MTWDYKPTVIESHVKTSQIDWRPRRKSETSSKLRFDKDAENMQRYAKGKGKVSIYATGKIEYPHAEEWSIKINLEWIKVLDVRCETLKMPKNIREPLNNFVMHKDF